MKILVVDDFAPMRTIVKKQLNEMGFTNIDEADDGLSALPKLKESAFDFLITGWSMPGMEGIDLLRAVRGDPELQDLPVLMITSEARREQIVAAAEAGVNAYIVKPFTAETLRRKIDKVFEPLATA